MPMIKAEVLSSSLFRTIINPLVGMADDTATLVSVISSAPTKCIIDLGGVTCNITSTLSVNKSIIFRNGAINFLPSVSNDTLFEFTKTGASSSALTDESQLDGCGLVNIRINGNRASRANAIKTNNVDNFYMDNVFIFGIKGFALNMQRSREWHISGFRTRYCGYYDSATPSNSVSDIILDSSEGSGDTTNFCTFNNIFSIYPFWSNIKASSCSNIMTSNVMVHAFPRANTALETNFVSAFGGSAGFAGGAANNEYADLHAHVTGNEASVSGLQWETTWRDNLKPVHFSSTTDFYCTSFRVVGAQTEYVVHADNSKVYLSCGKITGAYSGGTYGYLIYATGTSEVYIGVQSVKLDDARMAIGDDGAGAVFGVPIMGTTYSAATTEPFIITSTAQNNAGMIIGEATNEEVGFYGTTGVQQRSGSSQAVVSGTAGGTYTATEQAMLNNTVTLANELRAALVALGLIKGSA